MWEPLLLLTLTLHCNLEELCCVVYGAKQKRKWMELKLGGSVVMKDDKGTLHHSPGIIFHMEKALKTDDVLMLRVASELGSHTMQKQCHIWICHCLERTVWTFTLVVSQGEVGVVCSLWSQAVVEVLSTQRLIWIHCCHRLDQLDYINTQSEPSGRKSLIYLQLRSYKQYIM